MLPLGTGPRFPGHAARSLVTIVTELCRLSFTKHFEVTGRAKIENDIANRYDNIINRSKNVDGYVLLVRTSEHQAKNSFFFF